MSYLYYCAARNCSKRFSATREQMLRSRNLCPDCDRENPRTDPPRLKRDWIGRRVRLKCEVTTGLNSIPEGTELMISHAYRGRFDADSAPCDCCGVTVFVRRLEERDIELLPVDDE